MVPLRDRRPRRAAADLDVVGEGRSGAEALRLAADLRPDVILMDLRMPVMDGITATRLILQASPRARIVALTTFDDDAHLYPALAAGACGSSPKTPPRRNCSTVSAARRVARTPTAQRFWRDWSIGP